MSVHQTAPKPQFIIADDDTALATYDVGEPGAPVVVLIHGFASSADGNWFATGWIRELVRAGYRTITFDQRGHGASDKPHDPGAYSMHRLVADFETVVDAYLLDEVHLIGYSLGARVSWHASLRDPHRVVDVVLGGIPDGRPLRRFDVVEAQRHVDRGDDVLNRTTRAYLDLAARTPRNDLGALIDLVRGVQQGLQPDPSRPPHQRALFATGSEDGILDASRRLAASTPSGEMFVIPGRNHFNAPTSRAFRDKAIEFLEHPAQVDRPHASPRSAHRGAEVVASVTSATSPARLQPVTSQVIADDPAERARSRPEDQ